MGTLRPFVVIKSAAGTATAVLDDQECTCKVTREINKRWTLDLQYVVPANNQQYEDKSTAFSQNGKVRVYETSETYKTYNITKLSERRAESGQKEILVAAEHRVVSDLSKEVVTGRHVFAGQTASACLSTILGYSAVWSTGGTSGVVTVREFEVCWESVMSALQKLVAACDGEYDVDETTMQVTVYGVLGASNHVEVRYERNATGISRSRYAQQIVNVLYPVSAGEPPQTVVQARFVVKSYAAGLLTVGEVSGDAIANGYHLVAENDSWNGYKVKFLTGAHAGSSYSITDCAAGSRTAGTAETLTISGGLTLVAGDRFILLDGSDNDVTAIRAATSIASYGTSCGVHKGADLGVPNLVMNAALAGPYASGLCNQWTKVGSPTVTKDTTNTQYGGASQKVEGATGTGVEQAIYGVTSGEWYTAHASVFVVTGPVKLQWYDGTNTYEAQTSDTGWVRLGVSEKLAGAALTIRVLSVTAVGAGEFYLDTVQVEVGQEANSFSSEGAARKLWDEAFDELLTLKDPRCEYGVSFVDLHEIDPQQWPDDAVSIGDYVDVHDSELGINKVAMRVTRIQRDVFRPQMTKHTISNFGV